MTRRAASAALVLSLLTASFSFGSLAIACDGSTCKHAKGEKCEHCDCKGGKCKNKHHKKDKKAKAADESTTEKAE